MTMASPVRDEQALKALTSGDQVTAKVVSRAGSYWVADIAGTQR